MTPSLEQEMDTSSSGKYEAFTFQTKNELIR